MIATITETDARAFFRASYEHRYTWDAQFPGFTAVVEMQKGEETYTGKVEVSAALKIDLQGIEDEAAQAAIREQLREIVIHRVRRNFEDVHGKNTFSFGSEDESGNREIIMGGAAAGDKYKVRNNVVTLVHRHIHGVVVTIDTLSVHDTGEGYLAHEYASIYHDPHTGEVKGVKQHFEDSYEKVGNYFLLVQRTIKDELQSVTFCLREISLNA